MKTFALHLDSNFVPTSNEQITFDLKTFSGGEPHFKLHTLAKGANVSISHRLTSFNKVGELLIAADAVKRNGMNISQLIIPYFPAARQDRLMTNGEALSCKVYAQLINAIGADEVVIYDAHSDVSPALIEHCVNVSNHQFIQQVIETIGKDVLLISPDGGALKKIYKVAEAVGQLEVIECSKSRDVKTGQLSNFKVNAEDLQGKNCLIVDDICDGGGTFNGLAQELIAKNAGKLYLAVSHGIFSKGFDELQKNFNQVFTTNSFSTIEHEVLTQIELTDGLLFK
ncbi:MAG: ribose-phosphate pyrophosphokinase [Fluviicola sp.]|nr:ribose-phosphate pyrophosphokinase [Fluviicola sp.]